MVNTETLSKKEVSSDDFIQIHYPLGICELTYLILLYKEGFPCHEVSLGNSCSLGM